jgi:hypothetical protein
LKINCRIKDKKTTTYINLKGLCLIPDGDKLEIDPRITLNLLCIDLDIEERIAVTKIWRFQQEQEGMFAFPKTVMIN